MNNKSLIIAKSESGWINYLNSIDKADVTLWHEKKTESSIMGKFKNIINSYEFLIYLIKLKSKINEYQSLILIGNNYAVVGLILNKLGILKNKKVVWWGFYLHSKSSMKIYSLMAKLIESKRVTYVLFSSFEKQLYKKIFTKKVAVITSQFGSWDDSIIEEKDQEDYYFSGGYSNREYLPLIEAFRNTNYKLLIIASKLNKELNESDIPNNITVLRDVKKEVFHDKMAHSKGVIIPLKHNLGSSGQMVMINAMARSKVVIINDNDIMREYVENNVSGIIVNDIRNDIIEVIDRLEGDSVYKKQLEENSLKRFIEKFSKEPCKHKTLEIINRIQMD